MWATKKLHEVCDIQSGLWKGKKEPFTNALVLRNTNFTSSGRLDYSNVVELEVETKQLMKREVVKDDIILEKSGGGDKTPVGRVCIHNATSDVPFSLSNFTARLRVKNRDLLDAHFLHRFLYFLHISGKTEPMQRHSTGIRNLQLSQYKNIDIPLPPLTEQKRIVERLDKAFAEIDKGIEIAQECKTVASKISDASVKHALANQYFEWKTIDLGSIAENLDAKRVPITKSKRVEGDVPYYGASGIVDYVDGHLFDEELLLISEDGANLLMRAYPIAFPVSGKAWVNNHAHVLRFSDRNTQKWVERYLNATDLKKFISGMAQPKINQRKLNSIPIPLPNEKHMNELLSVIDITKQKGDKLNKVQTEKVLQLVQLKSAILAKELHPSKSEAA